MIKIIASLSFACITFNIVAAQSLERQATGAAGAFQTALWGSLSSTVGEAMVSTFATASNVLTEGFQQPLISDVKVYDIGADNFSIQVYPSPAADNINVVIHTDNSNKGYSIALYDLPGRRIDAPFEDQSNGAKMHFVFDLKRLAAATYMIVITDGHDAQVKVVKFTKIN